MKRLIMILAVLMTAAALPAQIGAELGARQAVVLVEDSPFAPALQLFSELDLGVLIPFNLWALSLGTGVGYLSPSAVTSDGVIYRGVIARSLWLRTQVALSDSFAAAASFRANLGEYVLTPLLFFYPEIRLSLDYLAQPETGAPVVVHAWGGYQFRQDLSFAMIFGIGTRVQLVLSD